MAWVATDGLNPLPSGTAITEVSHISSRVILEIRNTHIPIAIKQEQLHVVERGVSGAESYLVVPQHQQVPSTLFVVLERLRPSTSPRRKD